MKDSKKKFLKNILKRSLKLFLIIIKEFPGEISEEVFGGVPKKYQKTIQMEP